MTYKNIFRVEVRRRCKENIFTVSNHGDADTLLHDFNMKYCKPHWWERIQSNSNPWYSFNTAVTVAKLATRCLTPLRVIWCIWELFLNSKKNGIVHWTKINGRITLLLKCIYQNLYWRWSMRRQQLSGGYWKYPVYFPRPPRQLFYWSSHYCSLNYMYFA